MQPKRIRRKSPWEKPEADYVVESTGVFTSRDGASKHLAAGAKKLLSPSCVRDVPTFVMGVIYGIQRI
jgi:glyceraldehyde-3-phosphate dehydrogenase/erythrose-4-phosphate dehydrogenase